MKNLLNFFLVVVLSALPGILFAQANFTLTGVVENCSTSPSMLVTTADGNGGSFVAGMLSPAVGHTYGSLVIYHLDSNLNVIDYKWTFPSEFTPNPMDIVVSGNKVIILVKAVNQGSNKVATMVYDTETLNYLVGTWYPTYYGVTPLRFVSLSQAVVNNNGGGQLWDVTQPDPDPIPIGQEVVFSANFLDGSGFATLTYDGVHTFGLNGVEQSYTPLSGFYNPWGIGTTSNSTVEAYTSGATFNRVVVDYTSGDVHEHIWNENHLTFSFGETRIGLVADEAVGTSLIGNHTEIWCGEEIYDLRNYIPEIATGTWIVYFQDADYDSDREEVWLTGRAQEVGGNQRFFWYGKVPANEVPLEGIPQLQTGIMGPEKHDFLAYSRPETDTVVFKGLRGQVEVINSAGQKVSVLNVTNPDGQEFDVSKLPSGVYSFYCPSEGFSKRLVIL